MKKLTYLFGALICTLTLTAQPIKTDSLKKHVYTLADDNMEGRGFGSESGNRAASYIKNQFIQAGIKPINDSSYFHHFTHRFRVLNIEGKNVAGIIEGTDPLLKNEYIIVGAHYDHIGYELKNDQKIIYNGADDNASGVAAVIELAKTLNENSPELKRSIVFVAFDGEESGLIGSKHFVQDEVIPLESSKCMFSLDMVGMYQTAGGLEVKGSGTLENGQAFFSEIAQKQELTIIKQSNDVVKRTDTRYFGDSGIPSIQITTGTVSPYHKPEDDPSLIEYEGMTEISNYMYQVLIELSNTPEIQPDQKLVAQKTKREIPLFDWGTRVNIGSNKHNYPDNFYNGKSLFATDVGIFGQFNFHKNIALQPELVYETKGSKHFLGNFRTHSVSTPVNLLLSTNTIDDYGSRFFVLAGGYYSYNFAGKQGNNNIDFTNTFDENEYGWNWGIGYENTFLQFCFYSKYGLSNIYQNSSSGEMVNQGTYFSVGIKL